MKRFLVFVLSALSLGGLSAAIFYVLSKKDEDDFEPTVIVSEQTVIKVKIPKELVGVFIGRQGSNIKKIQEDSKARLRMDPEYNTEDEFRECTIFGTAAMAQHAETLIHEFLLKVPKVESTEMRVPRMYIGRIIGRKGECIRHISRTSNAKIIVENDEIAEEGKITIKGSSEQIEHARRLLLGTIEDHNIHLKDQYESIENRSPRIRPKNDSNGVLKPPTTDDLQSSRLSPPGNHQSWEVFVSAFDTPEQFWVQVINENAKKLDTLIDEMTEYYAQAENQELHKLSEIEDGKIVAAPFTEDDKWYRARVISKLPNEENPDEKQVEVIYIDYGDSRVLNESQVLELRTDYLTLRYQAIECFLASVKPNGAQWSEEAIELFDSLAEVALWKPKRAIFKTYPDWNKSFNQQVEKSTYAVELYTVNGDESINIGEELIQRGLAVRYDEYERLRDEGAFSRPAASSPSSPPSPPPPPPPNVRILPELSDDDSDVDGFYLD